jgi:hypothetical protein
MRRSLDERFWPKVRKGAPDECWLWTGAKTGGPTKWAHANPYGYLGRIRQEPVVPIIRAHVASWTIHNGPVPDGLCVLHRCDNTLCVNPAHLFLGTRADNARDRSAKGRDANRSGKRNPNAKLTPRQVSNIRRRYEDGWTQTRLAAEYGVGQPQISRIVRGQSY